MTKLQKKRVRAWVKALRSGKYKQGREVLKTKSGRYCCLGVACNIARKDLKADWVWNKEQRYNSFLGDTAVLPNKVRRYYGFSEQNPTIWLGGRPSVTCASANDHEKWSFKKIADAVENTFLKKHDE